ncbi:hypothetical protein [Bradyrhizobium tunisiense]|uniref:hypothetical protein n=1 Tax=Bradyrhizobium tunisiense TaxID=3278709 RepID=UPI0035D9DDDC
MIFVVAEHRIKPGDALAIVERQHIVYRGPSAGAAASGTLAGGELAASDST